MLVSSVAVATCAATGVMLAAASDLVTAPRIGRTAPYQGEGPPPPAVIVPGPAPTPPLPPARPQKPKVPASKRHFEPPPTASAQGRDLPGLGDSGVGQRFTSPDRPVTAIGTGKSSTNPANGPKAAKIANRGEPSKPAKHTKHAKLIKAVKRTDLTLRRRGRSPKLP